VEESKQKSNERLQELHRQLDFYGASTEESKEELIKEEFAPLVHQI